MKVTAKDLRNVIDDELCELLYTNEIIDRVLENYAKAHHKASKAVKNYPKSYLKDRNKRDIINELIDAERNELGETLSRKLSYNVLKRFSEEEGE